MKSIKFSKKIILWGMSIILFSMAAIPQGTFAASQQMENGGIRYFMQASDVKGSIIPYGNNTACGHYVQAGDAKIYYEAYGTGKPIFVFHGGGVGTPYEMGNIIDALKKDHQVILVSTRGNGRSEIGHTPLSYEQKATDMFTVMRAVTTEPAILLGFSDGAYSAYKVAAMYPEAVDRIIGIGAGTLKKGSFSGEMKVTDLEKMDKAFIDQQRKIMPEPERYQEFCTNYMKFWNQMEVGRETFGVIRCPVQLLVGDEDDHAPVVTVLEAHQQLSNSRLCVVPKAWHTAFIDNYPVTWDVINAFVHADRKTIDSSKKLAVNNR